jgi:molecular chaperone GrpE
VSKNSEPVNDPARSLADAIDEQLGEQAGPGAKGTGEPSGSVQTESGHDDLETLQKKAIERDEFLNLLQRTRADYANYQKRVQKENESTRRFACQPLVADLLPGLDNLERALSAAESSANPTGLLDGVRMVHQQLLDALARHGVRAIEALNKPFDPDFHEALMEQPDADRPAHTVIQELQKGYSLHDRVIRPARVIVSKPE